LGGWCFGSAPRTEGAPPALPERRGRDHRSRPEKRERDNIYPSAEGNLDPPSRGCLVLGFGVWGGGVYGFGVGVWCFGSAPRSRGAPRALPPFAPPASPHVPTVLPTVGGYGIAYSRGPAHTCVARQASPLSSSTRSRGGMLAAIVSFPTGQYLFLMSTPNMICPMGSYKF